MTERASLDLAALNFERGGGVVTVVAQHAETREVLMVAHADREALERTLEIGEMHYLSRARGLWRKGATSGNVQRVVSLAADCDGDAVLALVVPAGPACHTGARSCFGEVPAPEEDVLDRVDARIAARARGPKDGESYTKRLLADRNLRLKKLGEECAELVMACGDGNALRAEEEGADLLYHMLVALRGVGSGLSGVRAVLAGRMRERPR
jgi:phosphoribosyl-ATP pyrophosphohydrolase/phosphoribosyl-AMP cyclohydrolase